MKPIFPIEGAVILDTCDFTVQQTKDKILKILGEERQNVQGVDVILSDMAPNATGIKSMDHTNIVKLAYDVIR